MKTPRAGWLLVVLLLVVGAATAARLDCWFMGWPGNRAQSLNPLDVFAGKGQRIFATHFYRKADVYFHSGMYPTIFDNTESFKTEHMAEDANATASRNSGDEEKFLGEPLDPIDRFSRSFFPSVHTHLTEGGAPGTDGHASPELAEGTSGEVREILPWLKLAATLDPEMPEAYTVTAYWLRERMNKDREAELVLREGLKHLPNHPALLFELGRVFEENRKDSVRARNLWLRAAQLSPGRQDNSRPEEKYILQQIEAHLAKLEEREGNLWQAIQHWEQVRALSPSPEAIEERIAEVRRKMVSSQPVKPATQP